MNRTSSSTITRPSSDYPRAHSNSPLWLPLCSGISAAAPKFRRCQPHSYATATLSLSVRLSLLKMWKISICYARNTRRKGKRNETKRTAAKFPYRYGENEINIEICALPSKSYSTVDNFHSHTHTHTAHTNSFNYFASVPKFNLSTK